MSTTVEEYCSQCRVNLLDKTRTYVSGFGPYCRSCCERGIRTPIYPTWSATFPIYTREQRLEAALKMVGEWARNHDSRYISSKQCLKDIAYKCREALTEES